MGAERRATMGIPDSMVRFSVGLEELEDLMHDFEEASPDDYLVQNRGDQRAPQRV